ncbi:hypothetical protein HW932_12995 [Allochromatium humboldtianum]|uniref:Restriction endonuclease type IV Mrr domain-containing protein n=1 Tax=Allochromatium humboldtianum TaxID=504901 RepID=A0A850RA51_9GAMM|nr:hypothetical protein [Allochromatium humboldtianum]NVZ10178.1 hypothetical protein [Allochromatium humboldtianum]
MFSKKFLFFIAFLLVAPQANAFWGFATKSIAAIAKNTKVLDESEIIRLSALSDEIQGTAKVGKELGKLNLPDEVLEDTFLRIAIHQNKISREAAEEMFPRLSGVPGFRSTLRKIIGNSDAGTAGHLNEIQIADSALTNGFKALGIGEKFIDGLKKGPTDIDVLLGKEGKIFAIEAKNYAATTKIPMDKFRADLDSLVMYKKTDKNIIPIFTITNKPNDLGYLRMLQHEADKRGVQILFGSPQEQVEQIRMLGEIL